MRRLFVLSVAALALACGGKHRPPAVATTAPGGATASRPEGPGIPSDAPRPIESGPDVQPLRDDQAMGQEIFAAEGGPLEDIRFDYNLATLSEEAIATLRKNAQWLQQHPGTKVTVEGHCDERGTVEYNLALGDQRAHAATEQLVSLGVASDRMTPISYGKERPLDPARNDAAFARNRRAHFVVSR